MQANPGSLKVLFAPPNKGLMFINSKWVSKEPVRYSFGARFRVRKVHNLKRSRKLASSEASSSNVLSGFRLFSRSGHKLRDKR